MDVIHSHKALKKIKVYLVFFCFITLFGCQDGGKVKNLHVDYEDNKAVGITFDRYTDAAKLKIFLGAEPRIAILGNLTHSNDKHTFTPVIPFTKGQTYTIRKGDSDVIASFSVKEIVGTSPPELLAIYPTQDSVPENLLKMYFQFSQPMQEVGSALDFISVINDTDSTVTHPFLKLETELWNKEHTLLTLWFDPGRIKTDLIPNREKGLPLVSGKKYSIIVKEGWKAANGLALGKRHTKELYVQKRDGQKPRMEDWKLTIKENDSDKSLRIEFGEPLDTFLAQETILVYDSDGSKIEGLFNFKNTEMILEFTPTKIWNRGGYELRVQSRLEDLAGNNLNRLFDTDLRKPPKQDTLMSIRSIPFKVL